MNKKSIFFYSLLTFATAHHTYALDLNFSSDEVKQGLNGMANCYMAGVCTATDKVSERDPGLFNYLSNSTLSGAIEDQNKDLSPFIIISKTYKKNPEFQRVYGLWEWLKNMNNLAGWTFNVQPTLGSCNNIKTETFYLPNEFTVPAVITAKDPSGKEHDLMSVCFHDKKIPGKINTKSNEDLLSNDNIDINKFSQWLLRTEGKSYAEDQLVKYYREFGKSYSPEENEEIGRGTANENQKRAKLVVNNSPIFQKKKESIEEPLFRSAQILLQTNPELLKIFGKNVPDQKEEAQAPQPEWVTNLEKITPEELIKALKISQNPESPLDVSFVDPSNPNKTVTQGYLTQINRDVGKSLWTKLLNNPNISDKQIESLKLIKNYFSVLCDSPQQEYTLSPEGSGGSLSFCLTEV